MGTVPCSEALSPVADPFLECCGLERLVLAVVDELTPSRACRLFVSFREILNRCKAELQTGPDEVPDDAEMRAAIESCVARDWLERDRIGVALTKHGARALGLESQKQTPAPDSSEWDEDDPPIADCVDPKELERPARTILRILVGTQNAQTYRFDPRVHAGGAVFDDVVRTWSRHLGVPPELVDPAVGLLLLNGLATLTPVVGFTLLSASRDNSAAHWTTDPTAYTQDNPTVLKSVILQFVSGCEADIRTRAARILSPRARALALDMIDRGTRPTQGASLIEIEEFVLRLFPRSMEGFLEGGGVFVVEQNDGSRSLHGSTCPRRLERTVRELVGTDREHEVFKYFGMRPLADTGAFSDALLGLLEDGVIRVTDFGRVRPRKLDRWCGPVFRLACSTPTDSEEPAKSKRRGNQGRTSKRASQLNAEARKDLLMAFLHERGGWDGTLKQLRKALDRAKNLNLSESTLSRYLKGSRHKRPGNPHRAARSSGRRTNESEAVTYGEPASMPDVGAFTMPDDPEDAFD